MRKRIFLDYAAGVNNPNALYLEGRQANAKLEHVRKTIAGIISAAPDEIILTSWGTETNSQAIKSVFSQTKASPSRRFSLRKHAITTQIEHRSVLNVFEELENNGVEVTYLKPDNNGLISAKQVQDALRPNTKLISISYANNEIGTIQPIKEISRLLRTNPFHAHSLGKNPQSFHSEQVRPLLHSDCVQAPGLLPLNMQSLGLDMASFSSPKFGGPGGIGFLYKRRKIRLGSSPEMRENASVDLAEKMCHTFEEATTKREREVTRLVKLCDYFIAGVLNKISQAKLNGPPAGENRIANNANFVFPIDAELLVLELDSAGVACSAGAACSSADCEGGSHVIMAIGKTKSEANRSVRFSLGGETSKSDLDYVIKILPKIINKHTNLWQTK